MERHTDKGEAGIGKGIALAVPWKCCKVIFVLQMLSKVLVDEIFIHNFEKMSSAFGGFAPDPHWGSAPGPRRPPHCPPLEKIPRAPMA